MNLAVINEDFMKSYFMFEEMSYNLQNGCALKSKSVHSNYNEIQ